MKDEVGVFGSCSDFFRTKSFEQSESSHEEVEYTAKTEQITFFVIAVPVQYFRCHKPWCATAELGNITESYFLFVYSESEVS